MCVQVQLALEREPLLDSAANVSRWGRWADAIAKYHAHANHPRIEIIKQVPLNASMDVIGAILGPIPRLYLEFIWMGLCFCSLGFLISLPSLCLSAIHFDQVARSHRTPSEEEGGAAQRSSPLQDAGPILLRQSCPWP